MSLTPVEILHREFKRGFRGYQDSDVQEFLREVAREQERVLAELARLKEEKQLLQQRLAQFERMQDTLQKTLVMAQTAAEDTRVNAQRRADLIVADAERQREEILNAARAQAQEMAFEAARVRNQADQFEAQLRAQLRAHEDLLNQQRLGTEDTPAPFERRHRPQPMVTEPLLTSDVESETDAPPEPLTKQNGHDQERELVEAAASPPLINWRGIPHD